MADFIIKKLPYDLTSNAGLVLVGQYPEILKHGGGQNLKENSVIQRKSQK